MNDLERVDAAVGATIDAELAKFLKDNGISGTKYEAPRTTFGNRNSYYDVEVLADENGKITFMALYSAAGTGGLEIDRTSRGTRINRAPSSTIERTFGKIARRMILAAHK